MSVNGSAGGRNPLAELLESEKLFVERLGLVVRVSPVRTSDRKNGKLPILTV